MHQTLFTEMDRMMLLEKFKIKHTTRKEKGKDIYRVEVGDLFGTYYELNDFFFISTNQKTEHHLAITERIWLTHKSVAFSDTPIPNWDKIEIASITFKMANILNVPGGAGSPVNLNVDFIKNVVFRKEIRKIELVPNIETTINEMEVSLTFSKNKTLGQAVTALYDFHLFLSITKSTQLSPHSIVLYTKTQSKIYFFGEDKSKIMDGPQENQKLKDIKSTLSKRYAAWCAFNSIKLWPTHEETVSVDFKMHFDICAEYIAKEFDQSLLTLSNTKSIDPISLFSKIFDFFELMLRTKYIMDFPDKNYGRDEVTIARLIEGYSKSYHPSKEKNNNKFLPLTLPKKSYTFAKSYKKTIDAELQTAAYLRNRLHHTYLSKEPKRDETRLLDQPEKMLHLAATVWLAGWSILAIDVLSVDPTKTCWPPAM